MLLAVDIGNTSIKFGLFEGETLTAKFSIPTIRDARSEEIKISVRDRLSAEIDRSIVCSVVPNLESSMREFLRDAAGSDPVFVDNNFNFGLKVNYDPLGSLGTDRLVNAFAAIQTYGAPCIVCSFGTATTIDVVNNDHEFAGGIIAPGMIAMADALHLKAARLPQVEIRKPDRVLANSTDGSIRSGVYHGYVALVEGLITRVRSEAAISKVVGTGGNAEALAGEFAGMMTVDPDLLLNGLRILSER